MSLRISVRTANSICIVDLDGDLRLGPDLRAFAAQTAEMLARQTYAGFVLNVSRLTQLDSAGLGEVVRFYITASQKNCRVVLAEASTGILEILRVTRLDGLFACYTSEADALASFRKTAARG